jgi:cation transport regulator ChaC
MAKRLGATPEDLCASYGLSKDAHGVPALLRNWRDAVGQPTRRIRANQIATYLAEYAVTLGAKADYLVETTVNNEPCKVTVIVTARNSLSCVLEVHLNHTRRGDVVLGYIDAKKHRTYKGKMSPEVVKTLISKIL